MAIRVELSSDYESRLTRDAMAHGVPPEKYARQLLQAAIALGVQPEEREGVLDSVGFEPTKAGTLTVEQFHAMLQALAQGAENLPNLPTESFTRESFYED